MKPDELQKIRDRCKQSRQHNDRLRSLLPMGRPPSLRVNFARCAIDLALEHHSGLIRSAEAEEYGTAGALLRPLLEASTAGFWFIYVAQCGRIEQLPTTPEDNPRNDIPDLREMVSALRPTFPGIKAMHDALQDGRAKWLHKYTHGGTPQLTRRKASGWTYEEVLLTLIRGDLFSDVGACLETVIAPNEELSRYAFGTRDELGLELQMNFPVPPIPQQPHSLPAAPLLADGCGPPFD